MAGSGTIFYAGRNQRHVLVQWFLLQQFKIHLSDNQLAERERLNPVPFCLVSSIERSIFLFEIWLVH